MEKKTLTYLIVGSNSFLAVELASLLSKENELNLIGLIHVSDENVNYNNYKIVYKDIDLLLQEQIRIDVVFIMGAYIPYGKFNVPDSRFVSSNIELVASLSKAFQKARLVYCSSVAVYGEISVGIINENSPFNQPNLYGLSKLAGEAIVLNHPSYAIIRFSSLWGKGMAPNTFLPKIVAQAKSSSITVWGDGKRLQNYIHINDAANMCVLAAKSNENCILLGVGVKSYSNIEIALILRSHTGAKIELINEDHTPSFIYDARKTFENINFTPKISIEQGIKELL